MKSYFAVLLMLFTSFQIARAEVGKSPPPNIVFFLVDDMGWMDSTPYGSRYYETPNIERLAQEGMRFTDAYALPLCSPTRASIMTGRYSARHGITSATGHLPAKAAGASRFPEKGAANKEFIYPESLTHLQPDVVTLAMAMQAAGYRTGHFGKWHLGLAPQHWPERFGFDVAFHAHPDPGPPSYFSPYGVLPERKPETKGKVKLGTITDGPPGEYIVDRLGIEAVKFIEANKDRPFFLNVWQYGVHGPWGHKEEYTREFAKKKDPTGKQGNPIMASMLKSVDESLGRILAKLDELKLSDNTIVIFYSDNGGNVHSNTEDDAKGRQHPDWQRWAGRLPPTNNWPLRSGKGRLYQGGIRVPLIVRWPGHVPRRKTSDAIVGPIDMYPTLLDVIGAKAPAGYKIDGESFLPVLLEKGKMRRDAYFTYFPHLVPGVSVRSGDWYLIRRYEKTEEYPTGFELFNLRDDLGETKNLAGKMPEKVGILNGMIDAFLKDTGAVLPRPNPDFKGALKKSADKKLKGWQARGSTALERDGALVVTGDGKSRTPFLGIAGLKHAGATEVVVTTRGAGGAGKVQWRTATQDSFPDSGQITEFTLPKTAAWKETAVRLPVDGKLVHLRIYVPAQAAPVEIVRIEIRSANVKSRWDFDAK